MRKVPVNTMKVKSIDKTRKTAPKFPRKTTDLLKHGMKPTPTTKMPKGC